MKFVKYQMPFILWLVVIFVESSFPADVYPKIEIWSSDKLVHMAVYGILAAVSYISLIHQNRYPYLANNALLITIIICALYGASDELHQLFVPNRKCEFWDWLADFAGALIMAWLIRTYLSKKLSIFRGNKIMSL